MCCLTKGIPMNLSVWRDGRMIRPSNFSITRWSVEPGGAPKFGWYMRSSLAVAHLDPTGYLQRRLDEWTLLRAPFIMALMHATSFSIGKARRRGRMPSMRTAEEPSLVTFLAILPLLMPHSLAPRKTWSRFGYPMRCALRSHLRVFASLPRQASSR